MISLRVPLYAIVINAFALSTIFDLRNACLRFPLPCWALLIFASLDLASSELTTVPDCTVPWDRHESNQLLARRILGMLWVVQPGVTAMDQTTDTDDRILSAFLRLAAERGVDGVTTREIAAEAGVNPVTLFRRFGDKTTIAVEAIRRYSPAKQLQNRDPGVDPEHAADGLVDCLLFLAELTLERRRIPWLRFGVKQMSQLPEVRAQLGAMVQEIYSYVRRALAQAAPALRPEVDHHVTALQLIGLIKTARQMDEFQDAPDPQPEDWRSLFQAAIRPLLREV